ncbi:peptidoglycan-recognition protein 1-like isoform X1 [Macrosteles quadrilineatus]|uniref:peptidoglycan-recognition protein 1-like isoform X1 n=1 Tax=Macrosteles quadrilineatus TaxID=74068 RepID=UPI0023E2B6D2|nr:peptidoglycan-recognition protein 1-like isoform X1 [Macrosteles quadrilineatus]
MLNSVKKYPHPVIKYISREQWGARPPKTPPENLKIPVLTLHVYDTRTKDCKTKEECMKTVQDLQNEYMFYRGFDDIPWNFLIGKDGNIYEGRGFKVKPIKTDLDHPRQKKWDGKSIDVAYIGDYRKKSASLKMSVPLTGLIVETDRLGVMVTYFKLVMFVKKARDWKTRFIESEFPEELR